MRSCLHLDNVLWWEKNLIWFHTRNLYSFLLMVTGECSSLETGCCNKNGRSNPNSYNIYPMFIKRKCRSWVKDVNPRVARCTLFESNLFVTISSTLEGYIVEKIKRIIFAFLHVLWWVELKGGVKIMASQHLIFVRPSGIYLRWFESLVTQSKYTCCWEIFCKCKCKCNWYYLMARPSR